MTANCETSFNEYLQSDVYFIDFVWHNSFGPSRSTIVILFVLHHSPKVSTSRGLIDEWTIAIDGFIRSLQ